MELGSEPAELSCLNALEQRLISLRVPFMKMVALPSGKQRCIHGPAVNVPALVTCSASTYSSLSTLALVSTSSIVAVGSQSGSTCRTLLNTVCAFSYTSSSLHGLAMTVLGLGGWGKLNLQRLFLLQYEECLCCWTINTSSFNLQSIAGIAHDTY